MNLKRNYVHSFLNYYMNYAGKLSLAFQFVFFYSITQFCAAALTIFCFIWTSYSLRACLGFQVDMSLDLDFFWSSLPS